MKKKNLNDDIFNSDVLEFETLDFDMNIFNHLPDAPLPKDFHENLHKKLLIAQSELKSENLELRKIELGNLEADNVVPLVKKKEKFWQKTWFPRVAVAAICLCTGLTIASEMDLLNQPTEVSNLTTSITLETDESAMTADLPMVARDYAVPEMGINSVVANRGITGYVGVGVPMTNSTNVVLTYAEISYTLDFENTKKYGELLAELMK